MARKQHIDTTKTPQTAAPQAGAVDAALVVLVQLLGRQAARAQARGPAEHEEEHDDR